MGQILTIVVGTLAATYLLRWLDRGGGIQGAPGGTNSFAFPTKTETSQDRMFAHSRMTGSRSFKGGGNGGGGGGGGRRGRGSEVSP